MEFRRAREGDAANLAALTIQVWLHSYAKSGVRQALAEYVLSEFTAEKFRQKLIAGRQPIIVCEQQSHLLGYLRLDLDAPCPSDEAVRSEIATLYVQEHHLRRGIGTRLLQQALAMVGDSGAGDVWLSVLHENADAIGFYHRRLRQGRRAVFRVWRRAARELHSSSQGGLAPSAGLRPATATHAATGRVGGIGLSAIAGLPAFPQNASIGGWPKRWKRPMTEFNGIRWAYDRYEIIADSVVNGLGVVLALIGATVLIFYATLWSSDGQIAAAWIYGVGLVLTLAMSFSYNIWPVSRTKWILRRFDHSAIFVLIAATYTPFLERGADDPLLLFMLIAIWLFAAVGIVLKCGFPGRYDRVAILLYLAMGWSGVLVAEPVAARIPFASMLLIVIGGVIYSLGVIFHVWEKLRFQNAIWHAFVLAAAAVHYSAVLTCFSLSPQPSL